MLEVNLLPLSDRQRAAPRPEALVAAALLPLALVSILMPELIAAQQSARLAAQQAQTEQDLLVLRPAVQESKKLKSRASLLTGVYATAEALQAGKRYWSNDLASFLAQLPGAGRVAIKSIDVSRPPAAAPAPGAPNVAPAAMAFKVTGEAADDRMISEFLSRYEADARYAVRFDGYQRADPVGEEPEDQVRRQSFTAEISLLNDSPPAAAPSDSTSTPAPAPTADAPAGGSS